MPISIQFTRNGRNSGRPSTGEPLDANDVHFDFTPGTSPPKIKITKDGKVPTGGEHEAPAGAVDVGVEFEVDNDGKLIIKDSHWTDKEGKAIGGVDGYIAPPEGANDWHLEVPGGKITRAYWTKDGHKYTPSVEIDVPEDVNDAHLVGRKYGPLSMTGGGVQKMATSALIGYLLGLLTQGDDAAEHQAVQMLRREAFNAGPIQR